MSRRRSLVASSFANLTLAGQSLSRFFRKSRRSLAAKSPVPGRRLALESLEERWLLTLGDLLQTLDDPSICPQAGSEFGCAVAMDGNLTVAGAEYATSRGKWNTGCVYVSDATTGELVATLANPTPDLEDYFGCSVGISGTKVVVGARQDATWDDFSGAAYVFDATTGNLVATLANPLGSEGDRFGYSVAISGNTVVVGAPLNDTGAAQSGLACVFNATTGALIATLVNPTPG